MKNQKLMYSFIGGFVLFCAASIFYTQQNLTDANRTLQSSKKIKKMDGRDLVLGQISEKNSEVPNEPSALFNDPAIKQAWGLKKSDAARAWSISRGSKKVVVAVIDTGIDANHEDLKNNLWTNLGESGLDADGRDKATNGIDDDGNGLIDDVHGWNYVSNNNNLTDNHGHGTHIAGIIGAEAGNHKGIIGISPDVSIMVLKYYDPKVPNTDNLKNTVAGIQYAVRMGANIINYSGGGTDFSQEEHDAIESAERKGILFVAAAGNERSNSDEHHYYPADYKLKNIISVTAIDPTTEVLASSNYGTDTVDIAAPGQNILSCLPNSTYGLMTGTSQATAFVTGAAVLVMAHKDLYGQPEEIKKYILATGDSSASLMAKTKTSRQLNLYKALTILGGEKKDFAGANSKVVGIFTNEKKQSLGDPNLKNTQNKNLKDVATFGKDFMKVLGVHDRRKKPAIDKLGTATEKEEN
jgi:thermitase